MSNLDSNEIKAYLNGIGAFYNKYSSGLPEGLVFGCYSDPSYARLNQVFTEIFPFWDLCKSFAFALPFRNGVEWGFGPSYFMASSIEEYNTEYCINCLMDTACWPYLPIGTDICANSCGFLINVEKQIARFIVTSKEASPDPFKIPKGDLPEETFSLVRDEWWETPKWLNLTQNKHSQKNLNLFDVFSIPEMKYFSW